MTVNAAVRIDFLKYRYICLAFSVLLIGAFVATCIYKASTGDGQVFNYSVDFTGGTQILLKFDHEVNSSKLGSVLEKNNWHGATIRDFSANEKLIRVKEYATDSKGLSERIAGAIQNEFPENKVAIEQSETVSGGVGATLRTKSLYAVAISLILMLLYIAWRFRSFAYAIGAVVALMHDALIMLAVFLFFDREISITVIGAILAVLGYSINDTIVIFSQIRANAAKMRHIPMYDVVNISLNQTLRRTILTSLSTALTVGAMFFLGGEALRDFSLALLVGIFFGTYSSIYMASPIMLLFYKEKR